MEGNNILTAPQLADVDMVFGFWRQSHTGSKLTFYKFITTPSVERDEFLATIEVDTAFKGSIAASTVKVNGNN